MSFVREKKKKTSRPIFFPILYLSHQISPQRARNTRGQRTIMGTCCSNSTQISAEDADQDKLFSTLHLTKPSYFKIHFFKKNLQYSTRGINDEDIDVVECCYVVEFVVQGCKEDYDNLLKAMRRCDQLCALESMILRHAQKVMNPDANKLFYIRVGEMESAWKYATVVDIHRRKQFDLSKNLVFRRVRHDHDDNSSYKNKTKLILKSMTFPVELECDNQWVQNY